MDKIDKSQGNQSFDPAEAPAVKENSEFGPSWLVLASAKRKIQYPINIEKEDNQQDPPTMDKIDKSQGNESFDPAEAPAVKENSEFGPSWLVLASAKRKIQY